MNQASICCQLPWQRHFSLPNNEWSQPASQTSEKSRCHRKIRRWSSGSFRLFASQQKLVCSGLWRGSTGGFEIESTTSVIPERRHATGWFIWLFKTTESGHQCAFQHHLHRSRWQCFINCAQKRQTRRDALLQKVIEQEAETLWKEQAAYQFREMANDSLLLVSRDKTYWNFKLAPKAIWL